MSAVACAQDLFVCSSAHKPVRRPQCCSRLPAASCGPNLDEVWLCVCISSVSERLLLDAAGRKIARKRLAFVQCVILANFLAYLFGTKLLIQSISRTPIRRGQSKYSVEIDWLTWSGCDILMKSESSWLIFRSLSKFNHGRPIWQWSAARVRCTISDIGQSWWLLEGALSYIIVRLNIHTSTRSTSGLHIYKNI